MELYNLHQQILSEKVHDFFRKQTFFTAIKKYKPEAKKIIVDFLKKKGVKYEAKYQGYSFSGDVDYQKKKITPEEEAELKKLGFKDFEIRKFQVPTTTLNNIESAIKSFTPYDYLEYGKIKKDKFPEFLNGLTKQERSEFLDKVAEKISDEKASSHKSIPGQIGVSDQAFSATTSSSSTGDIAFPVWTYQGVGVSVKINSNEEFFDGGHDLIIQIIDKSKETQANKEYAFKVNLMNNIEKVLEEIWKASTRAVQMFKDGVEQEREEPVKKYKPNPIVGEINNMLNKWFSTTKTGKLKKVGEYKLPAEIYATYEKGYSKGTGKNPKKGSKIILNVKIKGSRLSGKGLEKSLPEAGKWHSIYRGLVQKVMDPSRSRYYNRTFTDMFDRYGDTKLLSDDHEKMFRRLQVIVKKLASYGFIPKSSSRGYSKGEADKIIFVYSPKAEERYRQEGNEFIQKVLESDKFKQSVEKGFFGNHIRRKDVQKRYIQEVFKLHQNS